MSVENGLYDAIGSIATAAHATGDKIDENIRPADNASVSHGLDVFHRSIYMRIGALDSEPRFEVSLPYPFRSLLRRNYTDAELSATASVDLDTLGDDERAEVVDEILLSDLKQATEQHEEFTNAFDRELEPTDAELMRLGYGDEQLWNGFVVRDSLYPYSDEFSIEDYRRVVSRVRSLRIETTKLVHEIVDVLDRAGSEEIADDHNTPQSTQRSALGFQ